MYAAVVISLMALGFSVAAFGMALAALGHLT